MTILTLISRSLVFHARSHLGALLGAAVGSAVLIGALVVGDSVRGSLRDMAIQRLAGADLALATGDRFFTTGLFDRMTAYGVDAANNSKNPREIFWPRGWPGAVLLALPGTATRQDGSARANRVSVYGVDERFLVDTPAIAENAVWLNQSLARQLNARIGDELVLRVHKPSALSRDAVIVPRDDLSVALRLRVGGIVPASQGDFSLTPGQVPPLNAFVRIDQLGRAAGLQGRANMVITGPAFEEWRPSTFERLKHRLTALVNGRGGEGTLSHLGRPAESSAALPRLQSFLEQAWTLPDAELDLRLVPPSRQPVNGAPPSPMVELRTSRIFLDPDVSQAALTPAIAPEAPRQARDATNAVSVLTYLVNLIRTGDRAVPYSMVAAISPAGLATNLADDQILVNDWLTDELKVRPGDPVDLSYYVLDAGAQLTERTNRFRVAGIVPMGGFYSDPTLMPEFPGLAKAESTHDWDAGFKLVHEIRDQDEAYWKKHRGTPKAYITLAAGQKMWENRFGNLTSIRWPVPAQEGGAAFATNLAQNLRANLRPETLGFRLEPVRERALLSAAQSQDFGGLFLGFSFFLIVAALLLMAMLFQFSVRQRSVETGTLLALGFTPKQVRRLLWLEGSAIALVGGVVGVAGGICYARAMLRGLSTVWRDAVGTSALGFHVEPGTLAVGALASFVVAWVTIGLTLRQQARLTARELMTEGALIEGGDPLSSRRKRRMGFLVGAAAGVAAMGLIAAAVIRRDTANAGIFFGAGALCLIAGIALASAALSRLQEMSSTNPAGLSLGGLGVRNCSRRRSRSLATVSLLACGSFLIAAIGVFRLDAVRDAEKRSSGTGGFALIGESSLPIVQDLNSTTGREFFGLGPADLESVQVVSMRVRDGDEASCLNLNRSQKPRLLGVTPESLAARGSFTFATVDNNGVGGNPWLLLKSKGGEDNVVPAIGDQASILWAMGKKVGDTLDYVDERGRAFKVKIVGAVANSILQGNLLIDEAAFVERFPSETGYRMFLIDAPSNGLAKTSATLTRALRDVGVELTPATVRLAAFNAVQNTYLGTFQILGGLGLLLGSAGLGVVVLRNVLERRGELALLLAVGFRSRGLRWLVISEHGALLIAGLAIGVTAAFVAVVPSILSPGASVPYGSLLLTLAGVSVSGVLWTWLATTAALRGRLVDALRSE